MSDTIIDLKKAFLSTQVRILQTALQPPNDWSARASIPDNNREPGDKIVREVLQKLNVIVQHHAHTVYSAQPLRHVAEQIDQLYWETGAPELNVGKYADGLIDRKAILSAQEVIADLPLEWPEETTKTSSDLETFAESQRYQQLICQILDLSEQRAKQLVRLQELRQLRTILRPFEKASKNIQPSLLVAKDDQLCQQLERMKSLLARVGKKVTDSDKLIAPPGEAEPWG